MLINFVDATNNANQYTKPTPQVSPVSTYHTSHRRDTLSTDLDRDFDESLEAEDFFFPPKHPVLPSTDIQWLADDKTQT